MCVEEIKLYMKVFIFRRLYRQLPISFSSIMLILDSKDIDLKLRYCNKESFL